jgi:hypothetical protein
MKHEMIESFFDDLGEYMRFLLKSEKMGKATNDGKCIAMLTKKGAEFLYTLQWEDGKWIAEYIRPFRATLENLELFNAGCATIASRLRAFIETGDVRQAEIGPPAFGRLSCESPEESESPLNEREDSPVERKYFPAVENARLVKTYTAGAYTVTLLTDVRCAGIIQCSHLLMAHRRSDRDLVYVIAAEVNNLAAPGDPSHALGAYPGSGHLNYGFSDDWGDLSRFENRALELMAEALGIPVEEIRLLC